MSEHSGPGFTQLGIESELKENEAIKEGLLTVAERHEVSLKPDPSNPNVIRRPIRSFFNDYAHLTQKHSSETEEEHAKRAGLYKMLRNNLELQYTHLFKTPGNLRILAEAYTEWQNNDSLKESVAEKRDEIDYQMEKRGGVTNAPGYDIIDTHNYNPELVSFLNELADKIESEAKSKRDQEGLKIHFEKIKNEKAEAAFNLFKTTRVRVDEQQSLTLEELAKQIVGIYMNPDLRKYEKNAISAESREILKKAYQETLSPEQRRILRDITAQEEERAWKEISVARSTFQLTERTPEEAAEHQKKEEAYAEIANLLKIFNKLA
jgi:hypothetical protein